MVVSAVIFINASHFMEHATIGGHIRTHASKRATSRQCAGPVGLHGTWAVRLWALLRLLVSCVSMGNDFSDAASLCSTEPNGNTIIRPSLMTKGAVTYGSTE